MEVNPKDPKVILTAIAAFGASIGGGSLLGFTFEPEGTTEMRVENAVLKERLASMEEDISECRSRLSSVPMPPPMLAETDDGVIEIPD